MIDRRLKSFTAHVRGMIHFQKGNTEYFEEKYRSIMLSAMNMFEKVCGVYRSWYLEADDISGKRYDYEVAALLPDDILCDVESLCDLIALRGTAFDERKRPIARYMAPVSMYTNSSSAATFRAIVLFPAPAGPGQSPARCRRLRGPGRPGPSRSPGRYGAGGPPPG